MIIGISGLAQHGKDAFGTFLAEGLFKRIGRPYVLMAYAHELKLMVQRHFDLKYEQLWGSEKEVEDKRYSKGNGLWTAREIMQSFGDFYRSIDGDFWIKHLFNVIDDKEYEDVVITDCRYPNEIDPIIERGGCHIRVVRDMDMDVHGKEHSSETSLDGEYKVDFKVENYGTLADLRVTAEEVAGVIVNMNLIKEINHG